MINPTTYLRPKTLDEALHKLNRPECTALTGGGLLLRGVLLPYATLIDMQDFNQYKGITYANSQLTIGGITHLQAVFASDYLLPRLRDSIGRLLTVNQRNGISLDESLTTPDAPVEWLATLIALNASLDHVGFQKGRLTPDAYQKQPLADFLHDLAHFGTPYAGFVQHIHIPIPTARAGLGTAFIARTPRDIPILNATALITLNEDNTIQQARVTIAGANRKERITTLNTASLLGQTADEAIFAQYASTIPDKVVPPDDYRASQAYRHAMSAVVVRRALLDARAQII